MQFQVLEGRVFLEVVRERGRVVMGDGGFFSERRQFRYIEGETEVRGVLMFRLESIGGGRYFIRVGEAVFSQVSSVLLQLKSVRYSQRKFSIWLMQISWAQIVGIFSYSSMFGEGGGRYGWFSFGEIFADFELRDYVVWEEM